jgi:tape measure domain-containing protein
VSVVANVAINVDSSNAVSKLKQVQQGAQATSQAVDKLNATNNALAASFTKSGKPIQTAANGMRFFTDATGRARKVNGQFVTTAEAAAAGLQKQGRAAQQTAGKLNGLRSAVVGLGSAFGGIAAVLGVIQAGRFVFAKTAEVESQSRSLAILAGSAEKAGQIIKELQDLGAVTPFTSTELIDSAKRLQAFGVEADKVVETTRRLADASGATGAELSGLVTAYGQVQAKGRLQGEELLQFQERGIALQEELRKMYGMTSEEFQKALSKGQVSAKAVEVALQNLTNTGGKYANGAIAQSDTLSGRLSTLQDNVDGVAREVGKVLTPALIGILQQLNTSLSQTPAFVEDIALAFQYAAGQIAPFLNGLSQMQWFFTNLTPPGWAMQIIGGASERGKSTIRGAASRQRQSQKESFIGPAAPQMQGPAIPERLRQKPNNLPPPLMIPSATVGGSGGGRTAGGGGASKAENDAKRALEIQKQQYQAADDRNTALKDTFALLQQTEAVAKRELELDIRLSQIAREFNTLKEEAKSADELMMISLNENLEKKIAELEAEREINELLIQRATLVANLVKASSMPTVYNELETQDAALQAILDKYPAIGSAADAAATLATSGISEMIAGTKSAEQVFVEFLSSIADALINTAKQMIAQYIAIGIAKMFAGLGGGGGGGGFAPSGPLAAVGNINPMPTSFTPFAEGGFVTGPTSAIIGEGGESEYVIPSSKMDAAMSRYSRGARGEGVIAGSGGSDSGDTAAAAGPIVVDVRYSVERINDVEYVTAAQFQAGMRQAAQQGAAQGEQRTLRRLQQSPSTRKRVGV